METAESGENLFEQKETGTTENHSAQLRSEPSILLLLKEKIGTVFQIFEIPPNIHFPIMSVMSMSIRVYSRFPNL
jgi:hypothetical protein